MRAPIPTLPVHLKGIEVISFPTPYTHTRRLLTEFGFVDVMAGRQSKED
ncbi:hypothetical protein [uncultured Roseobacter sp.]|nr:hypothetical protein [uncultured Roseobacter sp.]